MLTAILTVTDPGWNRYNGQRSSVEPARSARHGAWTKIWSLVVGGAVGKLLDILEMGSRCRFPSGPQYFVNDFVDVGQGSAMVHNACSQGKAATDGGV